MLKSFAARIMKTEVTWNVCRVCMHEDNLQSIYDKDENDLVICDKIMQCADITINHESNMPDKICFDCSTQLDVAFTFRTQCKQSDRILTELLEKDIRDGDIQDNINIDHLPDAEMERELENEVETLEDGIKDDDDDVLRPDDGIECESENGSIMTEGNENFETLKDDIIDKTVDSDSNQEELKIELENSLMEKHKKTKSISKEKRALRIKNTSIERKSEDNNDEEIIARNTTKVKKKLKKSRNLHICEFCGNIYKFKSALDTHMRRHTNEKPYSCEICGRNFAVNGRLTCHMRTHTGQKPYECRFCTRRYADIGARQVHERTHTGERPFKCDVCDKTFTYSSVLQRHKLVHTGEKQYSCVHCDKNFRFRYHLTAHLSTARHQDKVSESIKNGSNG